MRVLHVYRTYFPDTQGGLEETIRQICISTSHLGVESTVLCLSRNPEPAYLEHQGHTVRRAKQSFEIASCGFSYSAVALFRELARTADIINYHFPWPFADLLHMLIRPTAPTVVTYHSDIVRQRWLGKAYDPLMRRFLQTVGAIVCTSQNYFASSMVLPRYADKVEVIPIGLEEKSYPACSDSDIRQVETKYGRNYFLFVGVLRYYKGLHILLEAIRNAPFDVVIAGSGPNQSELMRQATDLRLSNVHFAGHVSDIEKQALFKLCRGVVFPSYLRAEAFGVTLLESCMHAKPMISTEVGTGTSFVNKHESTGLVVNPGSPAALRAALDTLWQDAPLAQTYGTNARARFEKKFTGEVMGTAYNNLYTQLLSEPTRS